MFIASMPLQANLKLSTNRPIVTHPHYEDIELRRRVKNLYTHLYGSRPVEELHSILKSDLRAKYLIAEKHYCMSNPPGKPECGMARIAHIDLIKTTVQQACVVMIRQSEATKKYFLKVFELNNVIIFKIL